MNWRWALRVVVLVGVAGMTGCGYEPEAASPASAQRSGPPPSPGSMSFHINGTVNTEVGIGH